MRRIRPLAAMVAAAVISVTALAGTVLAGTGSAGAAASQASAGPQTTTLTWHNLTLTNGWTPLPPTSQYGTPGWAVSGGVVYLRGAVHNGAGADLATLPVGARPAHWQWITYVTSGPTTSGLLVRPSGLISLFGPGDAKTFSSLSGVSFPVKA